MSAAAPRYTITATARAYVSMLKRMERAELAELRQQHQPYRAKHLAACWEAGWLHQAVAYKLGEGFTAPSLGAHGRRAWLRGMAARAAVVSTNQPQED